MRKKEKRRNPVPPFITSTLQQEASRHYGFSATRTMNIAQSLYEGVDIGDEGTEGLITYMRTDSVSIEPEASDAARKFIARSIWKRISYLQKQDIIITKKSAKMPTKPSVLPTWPSTRKNSDNIYLTINLSFIY